MLAPLSDGRLRVAVVPFQNTTGRREYAPATREIATVLRNAIPGDRFDVVATEVADRASQAMPDRMAMGWGLRADYVVTGMIAARGDSLVLFTQLIDVRTGRFSRLDERATPATEARRAFDGSRAQVVAWLDTAATIAARRRRGAGGDRRMP